MVWIITVAVNQVVGYDSIFIMHPMGAEVYAALLYSRPRIKYLNHVPAAADYYHLLRNPMAEIPSPVWEEVGRSVVDYGKTRDRRTLDFCHEASDCLQNILIDVRKNGITGD